MVPPAKREKEGGRVGGKIGEDRTLVSCPTSMLNDWILKTNADGLSSFSCI